jgi:stringent starvation protein B
VTDGQIVLNVSMSAVGSISLADHAIEVSARFGGKLEQLVVPYGAISAIYAKENGAGTSLVIEHPEPELDKEISPVKPVGLSSVSSDKSSTSKTKSEKGSAKGKPSLKVIK